MGKGKLFYEYGYFLNKAESLPFDGVFTKEIEENVRVSGGACPKNNMGREEAADIPDMETLMDMRRLIRTVSALMEEKRPCNGITKKNGTGRQWDDFHPKRADLEPFHAVMASAEGDSFQPGFSSPSLRKAHEKVVYHRGGKTIRTRKEAFT